ncbi:unnamed protein product [Linum tenue]|uniref:Thionin-like protein n=1 Tax=Linum tenue TaxID=586396 RepID=A0AAV0JLL3_9ROSI|nr:unnamed protein product [Linum tenue]
METKRLIIVLAMMLLLTAGHCHSSPSDGYYKRHKKSKCSPLCFGACAIGGKGFKCYGRCILKCLFPPGGEPDHNNPQAMCLANCVVPACAELVTADDPFSDEVENCLDSCKDNCAEKRFDEPHHHQLNHSP